MPPGTRRYMWSPLQSCGSAFQIYISLKYRILSISGSRGTPYTHHAIDRCIFRGGSILAITHGFFSTGSCCCWGKWYFSCRPLWVSTVSFSSCPWVLYSPYTGIEPCSLGVKGAVSRYSVIFLRIFAWVKKGDCSRKCGGHQTMTVPVSRANSFTAQAESRKCRFPPENVVFRGLPLWPPLFFPYKMAAKNHQLSWHCRFNLQAHSHRNVFSFYKALILVLKTARLHHVLRMTPSNSFFTFLGALFLGQLALASVITTVFKLALTALSLQRIRSFRTNRRRGGWLGGWHPRRARAPLWDSAVAFSDVYFEVVVAYQRSTKQSVSWPPLAFNCSFIID